MLEESKKQPMDMSSTGDTESVKKRSIKYDQEEDADDKFERSEQR